MDDPAETLRALSDPDDVAGLLSEMAWSPDPQIVVQVAPALSQTAVLDRMDTSEAYADLSLNALDLRIAGVLEELLRNTEAGGHDALAQLAGLEPFNERLSLVIVLSHAYAQVEQLHAPMLAYWDRHSQTTSPLKNTVLGDAARNGTQPAIELIGRRVADPQVDDWTRSVWLTDSVGQHRDKPWVLELALGHLDMSAPLATEVSRAALVSLFELERTHLFTSCSRTPLVSLARLPLECAARLRVIGESLLSQDNLTDDDLRGIVTRGLSILPTLSR